MYESSTKETSGCASNLLAHEDLFYTCIDLVAALLFDLSYGLIDPRIRMGGGKNNELS